MRRSIRIPLAIAATALPLAWACAGDGPAGPVADDAVVEDITLDEIEAAAGLGELTEEQRDAVRRILREGRARLHRVRAALRAGDLTPERARALARRIHDETIERLGEILTDDQIQTLLDRRPSGRRDVDPPLTEEQRAAIHELRQAYRAFVAGQREAVRSGELTAEEARARVREAARRLRQQTCALLTPEQAEDVRSCSGG